MKNNEQKPVSEQRVQPQNKTKGTDESAGLNIDEYIRIFDPNNQEVHLEKRA